MARNRWVWIIGLGGGILTLLSQAGIRAALANSPTPETQPLTPGILHFTYLKNAGAAFSIFSANLSSLLGLRLISIGIIAAVTLLLSWLEKEMMISLQIGLGLLLAGGISNTTEQIYTAILRSAWIGDRSRSLSST
ncbi:MAG: hypothetical protein OHK0037_26200 [Elainellaceae cyanobacterium]